MKSLKYYAILMAVFFGWTVNLVCADDTEEVKKAVWLRLASLGNMIADCNVTTTYAPRQEDVKTVTNKVQGKGATATVIGISGSERKNMIFSFLHGKAKYETAFLRVNLEGLESAVFPKLEVRVCTESGEEYLRQDGNVGYYGSISEKVVLLPDCVDIGLGMRAYDQNNWLDEQLLKEMSVSISDGNSVSLEYIDPKGVKHKWILDPRLGYAVKRYERILTRYNNKLNHVMTMEDFKKTDGLMLPHKMTLLALDSKDGKPRILEKTDIKIEKYKLNDPQNTPERYHIKWPEGTAVNDMVSKSAYVSDGSGGKKKQK